MTYDLVSIIIPAFNAEKTIAATLQNALKQSWPCVEIIVVDDGSSDRTLEIAKGFESDRLFMHRQPNSGAAAARNKGLSRSKGAFIQFLDADDLLDPGKIALQMACLQEEPGCVATGSWGRFKDDPEEAAFVRQQSWRDYNVPGELLRVLYAHNMMMHPACWLVPRAVATKAGPWDERLTLDDDGEYFCRVALAARKVMFVEQARSYYRSGNPNSLSAERSERAWRSGFLSIQLCTEALLAVDDGPGARRAAAARYQRFAHECYPYMPSLVKSCEARVAELGGSDVKPMLGGRSVNKLASLIGWRLAKRLRIAARRLLMSEVTR